jgi:hypothetical protein
MGWAMPVIIALKKPIPIRRIPTWMERVTYVSAIRIPEMDIGR